MTISEGKVRWELTGTALHVARLYNNRFSSTRTAKCLGNFLCSCPSPSTWAACVRASSSLPLIPLTINGRILSWNLVTFSNYNDPGNAIENIKYLYHLVYSWCFIYAPTTNLTCFTARSIDSIMLDVFNGLFAVRLPRESLFPLFCTIIFFF